MKKITAILLLALYLLSATELRQLVKLPLLVQHYREHRAENPSLTLLQFLQIHYNDNNVMDADYVRDMQLPFKSHDECYMASFNVINTNFFPVTIEKPVIALDVKRFISNDEFIHSFVLSSIWQPPRPFFA